MYVFFSSWISLLCYNKLDAFISFDRYRRNTATWEKKEKERRKEKGRESLRWYQILLEKSFQWQRGIFHPSQVIRSNDKKRRKKKRRLKFVALVIRSLTSLWSGRTVITITGDGVGRWGWLWRPPWCAVYLINIVDVERKIHPPHFPRHSELSERGWRCLILGIGQVTR